MTNFIKVDGQNGIYRDPDSLALCNTNNNDYQSYISNRDRILSEKKKYDEVEKKVDDLKNDIDDIKKLLLEVINKNG